MSITEYWDEAGRITVKAWKTLQLRSGDGAITVTSTGVDERDYWGEKLASLENLSHQLNSPALTMQEMVEELEKIERQQEKKVKKKPKPFYRTQGYQNRKQHY